MIDLTGQTELAASTPLTLLTLLGLVHMHKYIQIQIQIKTQIHSEIFTQFRKHCSDRFKCTDTDTNKDTNTFRNTYTNIGMTNLIGQASQQPLQTLSLH